jgi:hypothetical protein
MHGLYGYPPGSSRVIADGGIVLVAAQTSAVSIHWGAIWGAATGVAVVLGGLRRYVVKPVKDTLAEIKQASDDVTGVRRVVDDHLHWHAEHPMMVDKEGVVPVPWDGTDRRAPRPRPQRRSPT